MLPQPLFDDPAPRPSRVIAEALVGRHGPLQISTRAAALGLPQQLTQAIVVACMATAMDASWTRRQGLPIAAR